MKRFLNSSFISFLIHGVFVAFFACLSFRFPLELPKSKPIEVELLKTSKIASLSPTQNAHASLPALHPKNISPSFPKLDLRPSFMKHSISEQDEASFHPAPSKNLSTNDSEGNSAQGVLNIPPHVSHAFDELAAQVNRNLDYPILLIEHNVQGTAYLTLHFDDEGRVNENESTFSGTHVAIRGLLVKAVRQALVEWYQSDAYRLKREEFKNQTFNTELSFSYVDPKDVDTLEKRGPNIYQITHRRFKSECVVPGSVDLLCVALKTEGAIENLFTDASRIKFELLKDKLSAYDDRGLSGINQIIGGS